MCGSILECMNASLSCKSGRQEIHHLLVALVQSQQPLSEHQQNQGDN